MRRGAMAAVLRPLILEVVGSVPMTTNEIASVMERKLGDEGNPSDRRGVLIRLPETHRCRECGVEHECFVWCPIGPGLIRPHLDALAKAGVLTKFSRPRRSSLWVSGEIRVPDTVDELLEER